MQGCFIKCGFCVDVCAMVYQPLNQFKISAFGGNMQDCFIKCGFRVDVCVMFYQPLNNFPFSAFGGNIQERLSAIMF